MNNYYKQYADYKCAKVRLDAKLEKKQEIYNKYFEITTKAKEMVSNTPPSNSDKITEYLIELEDTGLSQEIENLTNEVRKLEYDLKRMEMYLSSLDGLEYDFIKLRYFEEHHYTLEEIARKLNYSIDRIKQISAESERKINENFTQKLHGKSAKMIV